MAGPARANRELVVYGLYVAGGATERVHTEDLALKCWELFPDSFSWTKFAQYPDKDIVRVALTDARKEKYGALVNGRVEGHAAGTGVPQAGAALKIRIEDIDLGNQRYRMRNNVIEIAGRHPSLRRYLGSAAESFPGQNAEHFRVLVAEIVADAVCADIVSRSADANPEGYANADWDRYYAEYSEYMTKFLPIAHKIVVPE